MVHPGWFVLCERASFDMDTNILSLVDCVEQVGAASFPATMHRLVCMGYLFRDTASRDLRVPVRVVVEPPGRPEVTVVEGHADFDEGNLRCRVRFFLDFFQFKTPGRYHFRLEMSESKGWVTAGRLPVEVVAFEPARTAPPSEPPKPKASPSEPPKRKAHAKGPKKAAKT